MTWWANCAFERTDLPMRIRDGRTLVVVEAGERLRRPSPRRPRSSTPTASAATPGRARASSPAARRSGSSIVWISPRTPDLARSLRDWGDFVHIRHIAAAAIPGFTQISVYENTAGADPRYMHFYEFDNAEAEATFATMIPHVAPRLGGTESPAYAEWADWRPPGGRLFYCNTFTRLGEVAGRRCRPSRPSSSSRSGAAPPRRPARACPGPR